MHLVFVSWFGTHTMVCSHTDLHCSLSRNAQAVPVLSVTSRFGGAVSWVIRSRQLVISWLGIAASCVRQFAELCAFVSDWCGCSSNYVLVNEDHSYLVGLHFATPLITSCDVQLNCDSQPFILGVWCREVRFDEDADRMRRKLEEMITISGVHVDLEEYPSSESGGWGGAVVEDGTNGGYVWKVRRTGDSAY